MSESSDSSPPESVPAAPMPTEPEPKRSSTAGRLETEFLKGTISRITFRNPESGFTILRLEPERSDGINAGSLLHSTELTTVVGVLTDAISTGAQVLVRGVWQSHPKFGKQFKAFSIIEVPPTQTEAIERYLASGPIKGFGPVLAKRVVEAFGADTLRVLDETPERLSEVPGIGAKRIQEIREQWQQKTKLRETLLFFENHRIPSGLAQRIHRAYGERAVETVSRDPYVLTKDVWGIGFQTADRIAQALGIERDSQVRILAGLVHTLRKASEDGHCFLPAEVLCQKAATLLALASTQENSGENPDESPGDSPGASPEENLVKLSEALKEASFIGDLIKEDDRYYLPLLSQAERSLAEILAARIRLGLLPERAIPAEIREQVLEGPMLAQGAASAQGVAAPRMISLSEEQQQAVRLAADSSILVITGGPGCGKTTIVRAIVSMFQRAGLTIRLTAPTGRAAQRLSEVCDAKASTIHRLLKYDPATKGFVHDARNPLVCDVVIVDESSMMDVQLACSLVQAIPVSARLIVVGDADQLPSVGPGLVLADLLSLDAIPRVRLSRLFRRDEESSINAIAHQVNEGVIPEIPTPDGKTRTDAYFLPVVDAQSGAELIERLVTDQIPKRFAFKPTEITVLTPMNQGDLGVIALNRRLQSSLVPLLPGFPKVSVGDLEFRLGDRVCQRVNNYNITPLGVFNGDQGEVIGIDVDAQAVIVRLWDDREVTYKRDDLYQLDLAYALTIHRSQGSEVPVVVLALHDSHNILLERQLIYTAITRAKQLLIIVGSRRALAWAVKRARSKRRYSSLVDRVQGFLHGII